MVRGGLEGRVGREGLEGRVGREGLEGNVLVRTAVWVRLFADLGNHLGVPRPIQD